MKFFIDTADLTEIKRHAAMGLLDGVTTNPSLIAKSGMPREEIIPAICEVVDGPISAEVVATEHQVLAACAHAHAGRQRTRFHESLQLGVGAGHECVHRAQATSGLPV